MRTLILIALVLALVGCRDGGGEPEPDNGDQASCEFIENWYGAQVASNPRLQQDSAEFDPAYYERVEADFNRDMRDCEP
ncbi:hypothetical protein [Microbacterium sp.]|uniref:hypothetical protein n=1 Tax=Microbacterium sp. TaxID=51671 RepID=UPI0031FEFF36|nr:hypothetical protein [Microbacterium sp.]